MTQLIPKSSLLQSSLTRSSSRCRMLAPERAVICSMVYEMCAAVGWLQETDTPLEGAATDELVSIGQLATAAQDHYLRMSSLRTGAPGRDSR
jgi:hypothetical protein